MANNTNLSEIRQIIDTVMSIYRQDYYPEETARIQQRYKNAIAGKSSGINYDVYENQVKSAERRLYEFTDKYNRISSYQTALDQAVQRYVQAHPKKGFFSTNPLKKVKEHIELFDRILHDSKEMVETAQKDLEKAIQNKKNYNAQKQEIQALEARVQPWLNAAQRENNARRKAQSNAAESLTRQMQEQGNRARAELNAQSRQTNENYQAALNFLSGKYGGAKKSRRNRNRKARKQTRKH